MLAFSMAICPNRISTESVLGIMLRSANVRNKLIHLIFAVIRTQTPYCENYVPTFGMKEKDFSEWGHNLVQS